MYDHEYVLGIESTADEFGCAIVSRRGEILSNISDCYKPLTGGIHPREAAQHHSSAAARVVRKSLSSARITLDEVDAIAVSLGPGLGPCLRTGATIARALAAYYRKPLVPVNHSVAHIEIGRLTTGAEDPVIVYASGGNTIVSAYANRRYRVFGETLDIALGNAMDTFALKAGLGQPLIRNNVHIVELSAKKGSSFLELPYTVKGQDMSFSGLLTGALEKASSGTNLEDLCLSFVETCYSMLCEVSERALAHTRKSELLLTGGVAASDKLSRMMEGVAKEHSAVFRRVPAEYATDNGAMVAWTGLLSLTHGIQVPIEESEVRPRWRLDEAEVPWRTAQ